MYSVNMLEYVGGFLPDEVKGEMSAIEDEMRERVPSDCKSTSHNKVAAVLVWCVRELVALRKARTTPAVLRERA